MHNHGTMPDERVINMRIISICVVLILSMPIFLPGALQAAWSSGYLLLSETSNGNPKVVSDDAGGALIAWQDVQNH